MQSQAAVPTLVHLHKEGDFRLLVQRKNVKSGVIRAPLFTLQGTATGITRCINPTFSTRTLQRFLSQQSQTNQLQTKGEEGKGEMAVMELRRSTGAETFRLSYAEGPIPVLAV
jgi:hypothetical protein